MNRGALEWRAALRAVAFNLDQREKKARAAMLGNVGDVYVRGCANTLSKIAAELEEMALPKNGKKTVAELRRLLVAREKERG